MSGRILKRKQVAYCAIVPMGLMPYFCARCAYSQFNDEDAGTGARLTLLVPVSFPVPG